MNRATELAVREAKPMRVQTASSVSLEDAVPIVQGGDTSVTDNAATRTRVPLADWFLRILTRATKERVCLADKCNIMAARASKLGLVKRDDANLQRDVNSKSLDGLLLVIGEGSRKIRNDPVGTRSAILRNVFGR